MHLFRTIESRKCDFLAILPSPSDLEKKRSPLTLATAPYFDRAFLRIQSQGTTARYGLGKCVR